MMKKNLSIIKFIIWEILKIWQAHMPSKFLGKRLTVQEDETEQWRIENHAEMKTIFQNHFSWRLSCHNFQQQNFANTKGKSICPYTQTTTKKKGFDFCLLSIFAFCPYQLLHLLSAFFKIWLCMVQVTKQACNRKTVWKVGQDL